MSGIKISQLNQPARATVDPTDSLPVARNNETIRLPGAAFKYDLETRGTGTSLVANSSTSTTANGTKLGVVSLKAGGGMTISSDGSTATLSVNFDTISTPTGIKSSSLASSGDLNVGGSGYITNDLTVGGNLYADNISTRRVIANTTEGRRIYINSGLIKKDAKNNLIAQAGNDSIADGTKDKPFKTIAKAVWYYVKYVDPSGLAPIFYLVGGRDKNNPNYYQGCILHLIADPRTATISYDGDPSTVDTQQYMSGLDRVMYFQGEDPDTVVIDSYFTAASVRTYGGKSVQFYNGRGLHIEYQGGLVNVKNITFRYNANNIPNYNGGYGTYLDQTDSYFHLIFESCRQAVIENCRFEGLYTDTQTQYASRALTDSYTGPTNYMAAIEYVNSQTCQIKSLTATGPMRYIAKIDQSTLSFPYPGTITLQNRPCFSGLFEVESGSSIINNYNSSTLSFDLTFKGTGLGTANPDKNWYNQLLANISSLDPYIPGGVVPNYIKFPSGYFVNGTTEDNPQDRGVPSGLRPTTIYPDSLFEKDKSGNKIRYQYIDTNPSPNTSGSDPAVQI